MPTQSDASRNIVLEGVPLVWIGNVTWSGTSVVIPSLDPADPVTEGQYRFLFDNLNQIAYKINRGGATTSAEKFEIQLSDNKKIVFDKTTKSIDGTTTTETEVTDTAAATGTGLAEVTITTNGGDIDSERFMTMIQKLNASESEYFFIAFPNGFTYDSKGKSKPDGWCFMFGKRSSNIELTQGNAPATFAITFAAEKVPTTWTNFGTKVNAMDYGNGLALKPIADGINIKPPTIAASGDDIDAISAGKMLILPETFSF